MNGKSYLIVGGLDYIGSHFAAYLLDKYPEIKITVLDKRVDTIYSKYLMEKFENNPENYSIIVGDCSNSGLDNKILLEKKIDIVLYIVGDITTTPWNPVKCFRETLSKLTQFLEVVRKHKKLKKFIFISSEKVYGNQKLKLETTATRPSTLAGAAIAACETMLNSYMRSYHVPVVIIRLSTIVCGGLMDDSLFEQESNGTQPVNILHIQEAVSGIIVSLKRGKIGEIYNIGGPYDCPVNFAQLLAKIKKGEISKEQIPKAVPSSMSSKKAKSELLWEAKINILERMPDLFTKNDDRSIGLEGNESSLKKVLIYGTEEALMYFDDFHKDKEDDVIIAKRRLDFKCADKKITNEINAVAPSHIIYLNLFMSPEEMIIDTREILKKEIYAALYAPWYLASFCTKYSIHFTYLTSCNPFNSDYFTEPNNDTEMKNLSTPLEHYMAINIFTDRLLQRFDNILFCRTGFIFDTDKESGKIKFFALPQIPEKAFHVSFLPDCFSTVLDLALKGHTGVADIANPIAITGHEIREICSKANLLEMPSAKSSSEMQETNITKLDTALIEELYPNIRTGRDVIQELVSKAMDNKSNQLTTSV